MTQKRRKADSGKAIGETMALRWEPTHVTKPNPRVVPLQNPDYTDSLNRYQTSGDLQYWKEFKANVCLAKKKFFNERIHEIALSNKRPWDLMNWIKKKSLPAIKAISYENCLCNTLPDLWQALHNFYNLAKNRPINDCFLNEIPQANTIE